MTHVFPSIPIPLHRNAIEEICSCCGARSWRYKDGTRWLEKEECIEQAGSAAIQDHPNKISLNETSKEYRLEDDLLKKSRPKRGSKRYRHLEGALHAKRMAEYAAGKMPVFNRCERCGTMLINPLSILLHQGGHCQKKIDEAPSIRLEQVRIALSTFNQPIHLPTHHA